MVGPIDIRINAAHPNIPLAPLYAFIGSPSSVRVRGVPLRIGKWDITAVNVTITLPDNSATTVPAVPVAGCWVATLPASPVTGYCAAGLQVTADGLDENGAAVTGYCLGVGDVTILSRDASASADGKRYYLHYLEDEPEHPQTGDTCYIDGVLKWYDGSSWRKFLDVVSPSTSAAPGMAADAKATGDALADRPTKAQIDAGWWSEWVFTGTLAGEGYHWETKYKEAEPSAGTPGYWYLMKVSDSDPTDWTDMGSDVYEPEDATHLIWTVMGITATRHRVAAPVPTKTSDLTNDGSDGMHPFLTEHQQLAYRGPNHDGYSAWTIKRDGVDVTSQVGQPVWSENDLEWNTGNSVVDGDAPLDSAQPMDPDALSISWTADTAEGSPPVVVSYTATRTALQGYILGKQTDKPLQPQGEYAPATNIPKSALASDVQASLGKADTAVQPYGFETATVANGTLTVAPYTVATYTADSTAAAFEIAVGALPAGVTGKARDCILVIDCTASGAVAPTVTWNTHFHPRTNTETDLAIVEAGKRAVFYISEYAAGEFAVGGWVETAGGSAT